MHFTALLVHQSVTLLCQNPCSKPLLGAYPHVLPHQWHINMYSGTMWVHKPVTCTIRARAENSRCTLPFPKQRGDKVITR